MPTSFLNNNFTKLLHQHFFLIAKAVDPEGILEQKKKKQKKTAKILFQKELSYIFLTNIITTNHIKTSIAI